MPESEEKKPTTEKAESRSKTQQTLIFISHDTRDAELAECFSKLLSSVSAGVLKSFRSSDKKGSQGIEYGVEWYPQLMGKLNTASDVVCLLTRRSLDRPWILYEAGVAKGKLDTPVYGIAIGIQLRQANSGPFAQFQNCDDDEESLTKLVMQLVDRIPESEPDRDAIMTQVKAFKTRVNDIQSAIGSGSEDDRLAETAGEDSSSIAKLFEEIKVMFQDLPSRLERHSDPRRSGKPRRRFHPIMVEEFMHMAGGISDIPIEFLVLSGMFRDAFPWMSELAIEIYRCLRNGDVDGAQETMKAFHHSMELLAHSPMGREMMQSEGDWMMLRESLHMIESFVPRLFERALARAQDSRPKKPPVKRS